MIISKNILHYKILKKLGEGGMGIVYLAEDTKLKREVAIKFLPNYISADEEERKRFEIEAQAAASLNHSNIATVHSIEEAEDPEGGKQTFIVMEYIDGKELKDIIRRKYVGAECIQLLQMNDIINYAIQIARGLETAHRKGIIHRDIKSSNIMITNDGNVKIMDFGLAKVGKGAQLTKIGTTIGTAAYMSPEQARGEEVDCRTDIWSFGVVLYEMLTGELPFKGDYDQAIIYSIMNNEPDSLQKYLPEVSSNIIKIIDKTLEKDPEDRYKTMQDVLNELKSTKDKTGRLKTYSEKDNIKESKIYHIPYKRKSTFNLFRNRLFQVSAGIFFIAVIFLLVLWFSKSSLPELNPERTLSVIQLPVANFDYAGMSPDGKMLAIPGSDVNNNWDIYLMEIKSGESRKLNVRANPTPRLSGAMFSPDGGTISFNRINPDTHMGEIFKVSILGGIVHMIVDTGVCLGWNHKGNRIFYLRGIHRSPSRTGWREYWSVNSDGSDPKLEFVDSLVKGLDNDFALSISPDDKKVAFSRPFQGDYNDIIIRDLGTGIETRLTNDHRTIDDIDWLKNGYIMYNSRHMENSNLWIIPEDGGKSKQITNEAYDDFGMMFSTQADRLIFQRNTETQTLWKINTDGSGNKQVIPDVNVWSASFSPDGEKIAMVIFNQLNLGKALVLRDLKTGQQETLIPYDTLYRVGPKWSPSGDYLSYLEFPKGPNVSIPRIKILNLYEGNKLYDFGYGALVKWLNDSTAVIQRVSGPKLLDYQRLGGRGKPGTAEKIESQISQSVKLLNVKTGKEQKFFRDSVLAANPVLGESKIIYLPVNHPHTYIVSKEELKNNPQARGKLLFSKSKNISEFSNLVFSDRWMYYQAKNAIWRMDLKTLHSFKVYDIKEGDHILLQNCGNNDKFITYTKRESKMNLIKIDNLFVKN